MAVVSSLAMILVLLSCSSSPTVRAAAADEHEYTLSGSRLAETESFLLRTQGYASILARMLDLFSLEMA